MIDLREEILSLGNDIAARADRLQKLIEKNQYDSETDSGLLQNTMEQYNQVINVDRTELHKLVEGELDRVQGDIASALQEAKELVAKMEGFLEDNENQVKNFLEDHNYDVTVASMPRILQEKGDIPKELFDET